MTQWSDILCLCLFPSFPKRPPIKPAMSSLTCTTCSQKVGQPCCPGDKQCADGSYCNNQGICTTSSGNVGQPCLDGNKCNPAYSGLTCQSGFCECGNKGQLCSDKKVCWDGGSGGSCGNDWPSSYNWQPQSSDDVCKVFTGTCKNDVGKGCNPTDMAIFKISGSPKSPPECIKSDSNAQNLIQAAMKTGGKTADQFQMCYMGGSNSMFF